MLNMTTGCHVCVCVCVCVWHSNLLTVNVPEGYCRNASCALNLISTLSLLSLGDTSAGGLLICEGIISPVVKCIYTDNVHKTYILLKFTVNLIIIKTMVLLPQA